ncbi:MAG: MarR family transcriptional regulator [Clostridia bacterium]
MEEKEQLLEAVIKFKKARPKRLACIKDLNPSEQFALFILEDLSKNNEIQLSQLRKYMKIAPSTLTQVVNSLEKKELIERNIDKSDRRNIYLKVSKKGSEFTKKAHGMMEDMLSEYIEAMGKEDIKEIIRLLNKTLNYFEERRNKNEKSI